MTIRRCSSPPRFFVFGDVPDWLSVLGYVLICGAGVGMFLYNRRHDAAHP